MAPEWVSQFVGIPYRAGGRTREAADCWGVVMLGLREGFGHPVPDYPGGGWEEGRTQDVAEVAAAFAARFTDVPLSEVQPGDVLMLRMRGAPIHCALVVGSGLMLHTEEGCMSVLERYDNWRWERRISSAHRYRDGA